MIRTYSLTEVAAQLCGDSMARPERWLTRQIAIGRFTARRVGRHWRMTQDDLDAALDLMANRRQVPVPSTVSEAGRPSAASMRRRLAVAK
jgi:hypothetical protein